MSTGFKSVSHKELMDNFRQLAVPHVQILLETKEFMNIEKLDAVVSTLIKEIDSSFFSDKTNGARAYIQRLAIKALAKERNINEAHQDAFYYGFINDTQTGDVLYVTDGLGAKKAFDDGRQCATAFERGENPK